MKLTVSQDILKDGLSKVIRASSSRATLPVLNNVLLKTSDGKLEIAATNLEMGIMATIDADVVEDGAITVPAKTLSDLVNMYPVDDVKMRLDGTTLYLNCGSFKNQIKGIDALEFPLFPEVPYNGITIHASTLKETVDRVAFAASQDDARPALTGVLVRIDENRLLMVAADGFRLSKVRTFIDEQSESVSALIPSRAMMEAGRIFKNTVDLHIIPDKIVFSDGSTTLFAVTIAAAYPDFEEIIPGSHTGRAVASADALLQACKAADVFARDAASMVVLSIDPIEGITISGKSNETGQSETIVDAVVEGDPLAIAFNVRYLMDALRAMGADTVALETSGPSSPGVLKPVNDESFVHVLMPMHIGR